MFNSLRSRLWLSYALLIALVLCFVGAAIAVVVFRSNIPLQQAAVKLQALRANALPGMRSASNLNPNILQTFLDRNINQIRGRIVVITPRGRVIADSFDDEQISLPDFVDSPQKTEVGALPRFYRDEQGRGWYYIIDEISPNRLVIFAVNRPPLQIFAIFRDQFLRPLVLGGLIAMLASIAFSVILSRWISAPLKQISQEAGQVAEGQARPIPLRGPEEVRTLAHAFNSMSQQVQNSQQSQKDFVANVSHELKTPLTSIQGFARAILDGAVETETELNQAAEVITSEASRMDRMVNDLLTLAKMDAGTAIFDMGIFDLNSLLKSSIRKFSPLIEKAGLIFETSLPEQEAYVYGDPDRLMQVLDNLLSNAIKFTPEGGRISLSGRINKETFEIHVQDSGPGIPPAEQERIFERFYQVDKARTSGRGYGLGLAISKQIVETHDGTLSLVNEAGEGSHFVVKLPLQT
ncbi:MAG: sensor histidine kinase [Brevefilum sp.]